MTKKLSLKILNMLMLKKDEILNSQKAIWLRPAKEIKEEEYQQFFKHLSHSYEDALKHIHYSAEGTTEFKALIYLPSKNPFNMFMPDERKKKFYIFISEEYLLRMNVLIYYLNI